MHICDNIVHKCTSCKPGLRRRTGEGSHWRWWPNPKQWRESWLRDQASCHRGDRRPVLQGAFRNIDEDMDFMKRSAVNPWPWSQSVGYNQAEMLAGASRHRVCVGQTSVDADGNPQHPGGMRNQIALALDILQTVLDAAGLGLANVVRHRGHTHQLPAFRPVHSWSALAKWAVFWQTVIPIACGKSPIREPKLLPAVCTDSLHVQLAAEPTNSIIHDQTETAFVPGSKARVH